FRPRPARRLPPPQAALAGVPRRPRERILDGRLPRDAGPVSRVDGPRPLALGLQPRLARRWRVGRPRPGLLPPALRNAGGEGGRTRFPPAQRRRVGARLPGRHEVPLRLWAIA